MLKRKYLAPVALAAIAVPVVYFFFSSALGNKKEGEAAAEQVAGEQYYSLLDGTPVKDEAAERRQVVGVMIDNHPEARPESGLAAAKIVYEAPVEGGLTRYLAIFDSTEAVPEVGPVRSARPYYLDWLREYGSGLYMHSGGSPDALTIIKQLKIFDVNEFYWEKYFWRSADREPPHNLYTKNDLWKQAIAEYQAGGGVLPTPNGWVYAKDVGGFSGEISLNKEVTIHYNPDYLVTWKYDPSQFSYVRYINDKKYIDKNGAEVRAYNVLIQYTAVKTIDEEGRREITTIGQGEAKIMKKGRLTTGAWQKKSAADRTRFYASNGNENVFVPGATWVEVVPKDVEIEVTN